ncbi:MAG: hypothetical protein ACE5EX_10960 [Phycisphaerae bacterium]
MKQVKRAHRRQKFATLAALALGTCTILGAGCLQTVFATIGATFF